MKLAKVVRVHPESNKVDLLVLDDGRRLAGVQVMALDASSSSGTACLPTPDSQDLPDPYEAPTVSGRDLIAVVGFYGYLPIVMGFLYPEVSQCLFTDRDRYIHRTPSDLYWTVDGQGNAECYHPSGAYIRIGTSPDHDDLTEKDFDKIFKITRNTGNAVHMHIEQAGGVASVDIAPDGAITAYSAKTIHATADAGATLVAPTVLVDSPDTHFTGKVTIDDLLTFKGGMAGSGGSGGFAATMTGGMKVTGGDVVADTISLKSHRTTGVQPGSGTSGTPTT